MSFLVVPPGPVSDQVEVELRARVPVGSDERAEMWLGGQRLDVRHDGRGLASAWASTAGLSGMVEARCEDERLTFEVVPSSTRAVPRFGAFWLDACGLNAYQRDREMTAEDVRAMVEGMHSLGASLVIFTYVELWGAFYYPSEIEFFDKDMGRTAQGAHHDFDVLGTVFEAADSLGMGVVVGLGRGGDTQLLWEFDSPDWDERNGFALDVGMRVADEVWSRYGHHRSFYGWYFTHEMNDLTKASAYYDPLAVHCRSKAAEKIVMVAPAGTPVIEPEALLRSQVDAFAYQDAVGAGYVPNVYTYDPEQRLAQLPEVYAFYRACHEGTGKHLWADVELWEMDGSAGYGNPYPPAWDRVRRQIELAARHVEFLTGYEFTGFVQPPAMGPQLTDQRAHLLYDGLASL